ncbi:hypothetical protein BJ508DRAFT_411063 [Ascobolus immersus RN42]|uniref:Uncharacterized protein n=1 Tax=Ascobolus immersus RN42 TaxID=1160509 RepID=A0A3N4IQ90_ASCIM|nr:hypothetical protein BJ508DRAFT_411063 [Ascobolus immersus RN42]
MSTPASTARDEQFLTQELQTLRIFRSTLTSVSQLLDALDKDVRTYVGNVKAVKEKVDRVEAVAKKI